MLSHNTADHIVAQHQLQKFLQGFPPTTSFNKPMSSDPTKENFRTHQPLRFCRFAAHQNRRDPNRSQSQFTIRGLSTQQRAPNLTRAGPKQHIQRPQSRKRRHKPAHETTRKSFQITLGKSPWEVQETTTQCATKNYLVRAFPTRAQQGTGTIKQEDHHEHEGKGQRHRIGIYCLLLFSFGGPPPRDDDHSHQDTNDRAAMRFASDTIVNRPWQGRQLFQAAYRGHVRRLNP